MKAIRMHARGGPERLVEEDAPEPQVGPGDALIRVHAVSITPNELSWSTTYTSRDGASRLPTIPGHDVSGVIESLGADVAIAKVGEEVYGLIDFQRDGACAEYVVARADDLAVKPQTLGHARAAAVPTSALTAWQALFDHAKLARGQRVLIHGAAGGVGTFAVQLANWAGAFAIGTASAENADFLRELGAHEVIDYHAARFEEKVRDVDVVLDTIGGDTLARSFGVVRKGGVIVSLMDEPDRGELQRRGIRGATFIVVPNRDQLIEIARLIDAGSLRPVIATVFPLGEAKDAFELGLRRHTRGKIVLSVID
jgi:NADPH:quinone reductase-like Zn-dependent oxidoreductase